MSRKLPAEFELKIEKLANNGEGVGFLEGKEVNIFGAFPGEKVLAKPTTRKKRIWKAELLKVIKASKKRRESKENHYLSCGPWQTIDEKIQLKYKKDLVLKTFKKNLDIKIPKPQIVESEDKFHYRNKMEFSFIEIDGELSLAFHKRYRHGQFSELKSCCLAEEKINLIANYVVEILNKNKIKKYQLKNLLVRYSAHEDKCLVALYVIDEGFKSIEIKNKDILGLQIIYSDPLSPATKTTEILHKWGSDIITENISGKTLKYYYDSFFQINPKSFEGIVEYLRKNIKENKVLVDLYSGVGTIGICLSEKFEKIHLVEFDKKASEISVKNAELNKVKNIKAYGGEAEKQDLIAFLKKDDTLIVDPPRSGMHPKAIKQIVKIAPKNFIYVSCNPFTQLRDMQEFSSIYKIKSWRLFDMYPQTPHLESVLILAKK